ncbi:tRNA-modifying protein YgfZ [Alteromonas facilis]|uniref:tRNA-modifying protein YgfZ n=1 Tax=Alteromonas facilis TaxID=2048004 RepID=UPI0013DAD134|nr:tRNA-modifying protein YgfZ [Alteromonas facilis]
MTKPIALSDNFFCQLNDIGVIAITGEQASSYIQGQVTSNVTRLKENSAQRTSHCDFKGKMWSNGILLPILNGFHYVCERGALSSSLRELKKYGVFSKVSIEDVSDSLQFWGVCGADAGQALAQQYGTVPASNMACNFMDNGWLINVSGDYGPRYLLASSSAQPAIEFPDNIAKMPASHWTAMNIIEGIALVSEQTSNEYVPQMLNLHVLDAIDFKKGCYMGQEVVARTRYLGKNKRATYLLIGKSEHADSINIQPGDMLEKAVGDNWRRGGTVLNVASVGNEIALLAVLSNDSTIGETLRLKASPEDKLTITSLPYAVEN